MTESSVHNIAIALAETWDRRAEGWDELKRAAPGITTFAGIYREMASELRALVNPAHPAPQHEQA